MPLADGEDFFQVISDVVEEFDSVVDFALKIAEQRILDRNWFGDHYLDDRLDRPIDGRT